MINNQDIRLPEELFSNLYNDSLDERNKFFETYRIKTRYNDFSQYYDSFENVIEKMLFSKWRASIIKEIKGVILEIGVGTGKNIAYYNKQSKVTAIDFSPGMLEKAKEKANLLNKKIDFIEMDAQNLLFKSNTFDVVIGTFVLCSIPDPVKALNEIDRVLKPGGKAIFIDHVLSKNPIIALFEHFHNPLTKRLFGFNINRNTRKNIMLSNLTLLKDDNLVLYDIFRKFSCVKA